MKPDEVKINDWMRVLFGQTPPEFFIELVIRTLFVFLLLIVCMRLLGRRMAAQLTRIEMIGLFSLAAAIGVPLQAPDKGLIPAVIIAIIVVGLGRLVATFSFRSQKFEALTEDSYTVLVSEGVVNMYHLKKTRLTIERLFAQLRGEGIRQLGEVKRLYFEANGSFSLVKQDKTQPGLVIIPGFDHELIDAQKHVDQMVCRRCGHQQTNQETKCPNCGNGHWMRAVE